MCKSEAKSAAEHGAVQVQSAICLMRFVMWAQNEAKEVLKSTEIEEEFIRVAQHLVDYLAAQLPAQRGNSC